MNPLPVEAVLYDLKQVLKDGTRVVLSAPPGAGKTTRVPLELLDARWLGGQRIVMLEPRRLAARAAAARMADQLGESLGQTVGYRVRLDRCIGPDTRIEVVTEGILTRMLQADPSLAGVGMVIFDEYHERHLESDLGLALCLDLQGVFNEQLRLLVMSATLDPGPVAALMGNVPVICCEGRSFPVETRYIGRRAQMPIERAVADAILSALSTDQGSILVFLPGAAEIRRVERILQQSRLDRGCLVVALYGNLTRAEQDQAIAPPAPGRRKIVLSTNIAETSLTIEGIGIVVDSGFMRASRYDVRSGMSRLETLPVSRASAAQRRGRAGRTGPGICYRLWSPDVHGTLAAQNRPEILEADLAALVLELSLWGVETPHKLAWLDPPPQAAFMEARSLLKELGALDESGRMTERGRKIAGLPFHPRLAHMLLEACGCGLGTLACELAALISERDVIHFRPGERDADLRLRVEVLQAFRRGRYLENSHYQVDPAACRRVMRVADNLMQRLGIRGDFCRADEVGRLLAWAYPDRIALRRPEAFGRFVMTNGRGAYFNRPEPLSAVDYLVAAALDGKRPEARIFLAASYDEAILLDQCAERLYWTEAVDWDPARLAVTGSRTLRLGALTLRSEPFSQAPARKVLATLIKGIRQEGIACLPWTKALRNWQARVRFLRDLGWIDGNWPDVSDTGLMENLEGWLAPSLDTISRLRDLSQSDFRSALHSLLTWRQRRRLEELAPTHLNVPSGSRLPIDYTGADPVLAVRVQELFGETATPAIADGRHPLLLHLLSPAGRPVQVTRDLAGFWKSIYPEIKKELKGRYPKHHWPDDPLQARATSRAKQKGKDSRKSGG